METVTLINSVFSLAMQWVSISLYLLKTWSIMASPKWLTSKGSATALMQFETLYPPSFLNISSSSWSYAVQWIVVASSRVMEKDPFSSTKCFTSSGDGVYWGTLKESSCSSSINPWQIYIYIYIYGILLLSTNLIRN